MLLARIHLKTFLHPQAHNSTVPDHYRKQNTRGSSFVLAKSGSPSLGGPTTLSSEAVESGLFGCPGSYAVLQGPGHHLGAVPQVQLAQDILHMIVDGILRDEKGG